MALGDVRGDRDRCSTHLRAEAKSLLVRKQPRDSVCMLHDLHPDLPRVQVSVAFDLSHVAHCTFCRACSATSTRNLRACVAKPLTCRAAKTPSAIATPNLNHSNLERRT